MNNSNSKAILYIAMSLDGYIARLDGTFDWLLDVEGDGGDNGYAAFYQTIGSVVMGRSSYEAVLTIPGNSLMQIARLMCFLARNSHLHPMCNSQPRA